MSPSSKEFSISKLITNGVVAQFLGNLVSFDTWSDVWIFKGLTKFLEYHININASNELFISEVLQPTLQQQLFTAEFPFSVDDALGKEASEKGEKLLLLARTFNVTVRCVNASNPTFLFSCLHFPNDLLCNRERSFFANTEAFDKREV